MMSQGSLPPSPFPDSPSTQAQYDSIVAQLGHKGLLSTDWQAFLDHVTSTIQHVLGLDCIVGWFELLPNHSACMLQAGTGWHETMVGQAIVSAHGNSIFGYILSQKDTVIIKDLWVETRFSGLPILHNHGIVSGICWPVQWKNHGVAILGIFNTKFRSFSDDIQNFLQNIVTILTTVFRKYREQEELYLLQRAVEASTNGIVIVDAMESNMPIIYVNPGFEALTGYDRQDVLGKNCRFLQGDNSSQSGLETIRHAIEHGEACEATLQNYRKDGTLFWNYLQISPVHNVEDQLTHFIGIQTDITQSRQYEEELNHIFQLSSDLICSSNFDGYFKWVNPAFEAILGYSRDYLTSMPYFTLVHPDDRSKTLEAIERLKQGKPIINFENRYQCQEGNYRWISWNAVPLLEQGSIYALGRDISDQKVMQEQIHHQAFHDFLTGLPNRRQLMATLQTYLTPQGCANQSFSLFFLDLDRFKIINDSLGHSMGDRLLVALVKRLKLALRPQDILVRWGGDEFIVFLPHINQKKDVLIIAQAIHSQLQDCLNIQGHEIFTSVSIGIVLSNDLPQNIPVTVDDLLRYADTALHQAKSRGKGKSVLFHHNMPDVAIARLHMETDLRRALDRQEFFLEYQPIVNLHTNHLESFEALIRWQHPQRGRINPGHFLPIVEEADLAVALGEWVLETACQQLKIWRRQYPQAAAHLSVSVNLSPRQFKQVDVLQSVQQALVKAQVPGSCLKLEITEDAFLDTVDLERAAQILHQLKLSQVKVCLDDFGTGYSSLNYLHRLPVDVLKIDGSFIRPLCKLPEQNTIVRSIIQLAHNLHIQTVAEYVETPIQVQQLQDFGCDFGQGSHFAMAMTADRAAAWIEHQGRPQS